MRFREMADLLPQTVFEADEKGNLTFTNCNAFGFFGYTRDDFDRGVNVFQVVARDDRQRAQENIARVLRGEKSRGNEYMALRKDGSTFPVLIYSSPIIREDKSAGVRGIVIDTTEHKKLERQLRQAQKMEAIGQLAGGIAHDFNNILTAITGYGHLLLMRMGENSPLRHQAEAIIASSGKAAHLTQSLLAFSRKQMIRLEPVNLNDLITRFGDLLSRIIGEDIKLEMELAGQDLPILADSLQIEQVLMNLATNARDAMQRTYCRRGDYLKENGNSFQSPFHPKSS